MDKRKIFVIGPIIPFTGGIAHSNTTLCRNLSKRNDVTAISFSMMFPKILYPGDKQKDGSHLKKPPFRQEFILNSLNPISWLRVVNKIRCEKPAWVILQWWHTYFVPCYITISLLSRLFGVKVNIVCQNVLVHEKGPALKLIHKPLTKLLFKTVNHLTTLSSSDLVILKKLCPTCKGDFIIEGTYGGVTGKTNFTKTQAMKKLKLPNKKIVLAFGAIRPYKDLGMLIDAIALSVKTHKDILLVIAGAFWEPKEKYDGQIKKLGIEKNVLIKAGYAPDEQIPLLFKAADVTILSHKSATESGIPQIAYEYNTPIIATAVGGNVDLIDNNKTGFLVKSENSKAMSEAINNFFSKKLYLPFKKEMKKKEYIFEWTKEKENSFFGE
jgi:glycosyltransferase involved in cell wall biosynthesis